MNLTTTISSGGRPFEGDRVLFLRGIPENARVTSALVRVRPSDPNAGFSVTKEISFVDPVQTFGATRASGSGGAGTTSTNRWIEVDFHARRTLDSVSGTELLGTTLQVDMGGAFVEINRNGAFAARGDPRFTLGGNTSDLPGLTVFKFKLTKAGPEPNVTTVRIRSVPSNVSFRIGTQTPFWTITGELAVESQSPDFSDLLQAFLADAETSNGFYVVPLVVHSDTLAEMDIVFELEFVSEQSLLSPGVDETFASFDPAGAVAGDSSLPALRFPKQVPVAVRRLSGRIEGEFDDSRIAAGPRGPVTNTTAVPSSKTTARTLQPDRASPALAQAIQVGTQLKPERQVAATRIDVLLAVQQSSRLQLDLRRDADGRPSANSILPTPINFSVDPHVSDKPVWANVPLASELILGGIQGEGGEPVRYWLVLQSIARGSFDWHARPREVEGELLLRTENGGASWTDKELGSLSAVFRVRHEPENFTVPIELQFGEGDKAVPVKLDQFAPLGRVDFSLDFPDAVDKTNQTLDKINQTLDKPAVERCPEVEHLANGDFEFWVRTSESDDPDDGVTEQPEEWNLVSGSVGKGNQVVLHDAESPTILSQVTPVQGSCTYEFSFFAGANNNGSQARIHWLNESCEPIGEPDRVLIEESESFETEVADQFYRQRVTAPDAAVQAEVRFFAPGGDTVSLGAVSLMGTVQRLANSDLKQLEEQADENDLRPVGWSIEPVDANVDFSLASSQNTIEFSDSVRFGNSTVPFVLSQSFEAEPEQSFELQIVARTELQVAATSRDFNSETELLATELSWLDSSGQPVGAPTVVDIQSDGLNAHVANGTTPRETAAGTLRLRMPRNTNALVKDISLRFLGRAASLPISIIAETAGTVTLSDFRAEFEPREIKAPEVPSSGLCEPADADGEEFCIEHAASGHVKCPSCGAAITEFADRVTRNQRPARIGPCTRCEDGNVHVVRFGGRLNASAPLLPTHRARQESIPDSSIASDVTEQIAQLELTSINGVGQATRDRLANVSVRVETIAQLAGLDPTTVVDGVPQLVKLIEQAKELTSPTATVQDLQQNLDNRVFDDLNREDVASVRGEQIAQLAVTSIRGVGGATRDRLANVTVRVETIAQLAGLDPETVVDSVPQLVTLVEQAKELTSPTATVQDLQQNLDKRVFDDLNLVR